MLSQSLYVLGRVYLFTCGKTPTARFAISVPECKHQRGVGSSKCTAADVGKLNKAANRSCTPSADNPLSGVSSWSDPEERGELGTVKT